MDIDTRNAPQVDPELTPAEAGCAAYDSGQRPPTEAAALFAYQQRPADYGDANVAEFETGRAMYFQGLPMRVMPMHDGRMGWLCAKLEATGAWGDGYADKDSTL